MAYIRVDVPHTVINGSTVSFLAPCPCNAVDGLKVYFPNDKGIATNQTFVFVDTHGNNLTGVGNLFLAGAIVKAILSVSEGKAYLQNADTNKYLEDKFSGKADLQNGKVPAEQLPEMDYAESDHKHAAGDVTSGTFDAARIPTLAASKVTSGTFAATGVKAASGTDYTTARIRNIKAQTSDLTAGTTSLTNGEICLVYE